MVQAVYEYDGEEFTGDKGKILVNNIPLMWSISERVLNFSINLDGSGKLTFEVSGIEDMQYKLTTFTDAVGPQSIVWEKPFLETAAGIASVAAILAVIAAWTIFFYLREKSNCYFDFLLHDLNNVWKHQIVDDFKKSLQRWV